MPNHRPTMDKTLRVRIIEEGHPYQGCDAVVQWRGRLHSDQYLMVAEVEADGALIPFQLIDDFLGLPDSHQAEARRMFGEYMADRSPELAAGTEGGGR